MLVRGRCAPEPGIVGDIDEELGILFYEPTGQVREDGLVTDEHPKLPPRQSQVMDPLTGREIADRADDIPGESENPGKGGILPERNEMDFIISPQDLFFWGDQEGAVEIIYSGPIALKGWRAEKQGGIHLMR